jgi:hypothetical protein
MLARPSARVPSVFLSRTGARSVGPRLSRARAVRPWRLAPDRVPTSHLANPGAVRARPLLLRREWSLCGNRADQSGVGPSVTLTGMVAGMLIALVAPVMVISLGGSTGFEIEVGNLTLGSRDSGPVTHGGSR